MGLTEDEFVLNHKNWEANNPVELDKVIKTYEGIQADFSGDVSIADLIVLGGNLGVETAAKKWRI